VDIVTLPVESWREYRELRLRALKEDPEAFSSSYADSQDQPEQFWKGRLADAADGKRAWLLFAIQDNIPVGMIGAFIEAPSPDVATVVSVYVPREARGQGISARLMEEILRLLSNMPALKKARLRVNVTQLPAINLYRRFGFLEIALEPSTTGTGQVVQQMLMERDLPARSPA
jgi:ribosomal protein S18 acetylase RimI-like enzyme